MDVFLCQVFINPLYEKDELKYCVNKLQMKGLLIGEKIKNRDYYEILNKLVPELPTSKEGSLQSKNCPSLRHIITTGKEKLELVKICLFIIFKNIIRSIFLIKNGCISFTMNASELLGNTGELLYYLY